MIQQNVTCPLSKYYRCSTFSDDNITFYKANEFEYGVENSTEMQCVLLNLNNRDKFKILCVLNEFYFLSNKEKKAVLISNKKTWHGDDDLQPFECKEAIALFPNLYETSTRVLKLLAKKATLDGDFLQLKIVPNTGFMGRSTISHNYEFFFGFDYEHINSTLSTLEKANCISVIREGNNGKILKITLTEEGLKKGNSVKAKKQIKKCFVAMKFSRMSEFTLLDSIGLQYTPLSNIAKIRSEIQRHPTLSLKNKNRDNDRFWKSHIKGFIEKEFGISCIRVDESCRNGEIPANIKALICESDFVICDLTYNNNGVYYEAGYAHALEKEVIFICEAAHFHFLHFDLRHYNVLLYKKNEMQKFESELGKRILELINK